MQRLVEFLSGKKTYITGVVMVILGLLQGDNKLVLEGIGLITVRQAITKHGI